jgi:antitoxin YefM
MGSEGLGLAEFEAVRAHSTAITAATAIIVAGLTPQVLGQNQVRLSCAGATGGQRAPRVTYVHMSTHSLRDLRGSLGAVVRAVTATGEEAIITDSGTEIAVIVSMADYERLHEHADVVDALRLREMQATRFKAMPLAQMLEELGVDAGAFIAG